MNNAGKDTVDYNAEIRFGSLSSTFPPMESVSPTKIPNKVIKEKKAFSLNEGTT